MKILFIGQLADGQTSKMRMDVLGHLGHQIIPLNSQTNWDNTSWLSRRIQQKFTQGPVISKLNTSLIDLARQHGPDLLWAEKQEYIRPETLSELHEMDIKTLHFTPDPYFTLSWKRTDLMDRCMKLFDYVITSKSYELEEYKRTCQRVIYMPLGYAKDVHRPCFSIDPNIRHIYKSDVSFIGGWEPRRERLLDAVAQKTNCHLKIWGYSWDHIRDGRWNPRRAYRLKLIAGADKFQIKKNKLLERALQGNEIYSDRYAWALSGASISIGFLRFVCPDQHTTRSFEIPACGTMMIADRTDEHQSFFKEGQEAEYFSSEEELVDKVKYYLKHESQRTKIAHNGLLRCINSGYSYEERLLNIINQIQE